MKNMKRGILSILGLAAVALVFASCAQDREIQTSAHYNLPEDAVGTVRSAEQVLDDFVAVSGRNIPTEVLENASGIAIIPDLTKAAFIAGGRHGKGVFLNQGQEEWSLPVFASITGASLGMQFGISSTDLVLVFQNPNAIDRLKEGGSFTLGADLAVAAGPLGGSANLSTLDADVLAYSRSEGAFAGISFSGGNMSLNRDDTIAYYTAAQAGGDNARGYYGDERDGDMFENLLEPDQASGFGNAPSGAADLKQTLDRLTSGGGKK